uniref:R3H domain-containing protein n=1 Tax=Rhodosorus marinus TaxID=101924 RepID=A0A7S0BK58_9RHOD|mmetsp:Transcript_19186/g.27805  ORF Transcript_19186/g.27805 Transcript_19186/m.27805 type:complete len:474 (+) Transcript_19186:576-1997(+)
MEMRKSAWTEGAESPTEDSNESPVVDDFLLSLLQNPKNRGNLVKLEANLDNFVRDASLQRLEVPPKKAFQRKIVHKVAVRYNLENKLVAPASNSGVDEARALILIKTEATAIPKTRLSDIDVSLQKQSRDTDKLDSAMKTMSIRRRESDQAHGKGCNLHKKNQNSGTIRSITEEEYAKARARIFQNSDSGRDSSVESDGKQPVARPRQPLGPVDGSKGFTRRAVADGVQPPPSSTVGVSPCVASPVPIERGEFAVPKPSAAERNSLRSDWLPQSDGQLDSLTSNRTPRQQWENDFYDPDFDRSYHRWVTPTPPFVPIGHDPFTGMSRRGIVGPEEWMWVNPRIPSSANHGVVDGASDMAGMNHTYPVKGTSGNVDMSSTRDQRADFGEKGPVPVVSGYDLLGPPDAYLGQARVVSTQPQDQYRPQASSTAGARVPVADYNSAADFPPLAGPVAPSTREAASSSGFSWEVTRVD